MDSSDPLTRNDAASIEPLLAQADWLRALARSLVRDPLRAEELAQATLVDAWRSPPRESGNLRGWLAVVLRRRLRGWLRGEARRRVHEAAAARGEALDVDESARERLHTQRWLAEHVLALDEPYRTVIVLRYFEALPPRRIAERLGVGVSTVRSRLQRALEQLHRRLDGSVSRERGHWAALVAVSESAPGTAAAPLSWLPGAWLMQAKWVAGVVGLCVVGWWWWSRGQPDALEVSAVAPAISTRLDAPMAEAGGAVATAQDPRRVASSGPAPVSSKPATTSRGHLVDVEGRPLPGLRLRFRGTRTPRWQGGDSGYISDGEQSRFVSTTLERELREDAGKASEFFADIERADDWRALILGSALPEREVVSDSTGGFDLRSGPKNIEVDVVEAGWMTLASGVDAAGDRWCVAAPHLRLGGRLLGLADAPIREGKVEFRWKPELALAALPAGLRWDRLHEPVSINHTSEDGYLLREVPARVPGGVLVASAQGFVDAHRPTPVESSTAFDFLMIAATRGVLVFDGRVVDGADRPIEGAEVILARRTIRTDAEGRFAFREAELPDDALLTAIAPGFAAVQRADLVPSARHDPASVRDMTLRLDVPARVLRGTVIDAAGSPMASLRVNLFDPELLDFSFTPLEGRAGDWELGVLTDDMGRFAISGLARRPYRLRVWREESTLAFVSDAFPPDANDVVVRIDAASQHARVLGQVRGDFPRDLRVSVAWFVHVTRSGAGSRAEGSSPLPVSADGRFELREVPIRDAYVVLLSDSGSPRAVPVEAIRRQGDEGRLDVDWASPPPLEIIVRGVLRENASLRFVDAGDSPVNVEAYGDPRATPRSWIAARDGRFPSCIVPSTAAGAWLDDGSGAWRRIPLVDDDAGLRRLIVELR